MNINTENPKQKSKHKNSKKPQSSVTSSIIF